MGDNNVELALRNVVGTITSEPVKPLVGGSSSKDGGKKEPEIFVFGIPIKYLSLFILVVQNSALVIVMRYSRIMPGDMFFSSTAVVVSEVFKMITCCFIVWATEKYHFRAFIQRLREDIFDLPTETLKLAVPSILYTVQNNLQYVAVSNLDAATFQVTYQLKILTTAMFSVLMLNKTLSPVKWWSLIILTLGVGLVQIPPDYFSGHKADEKPHQNTFVGLVAVLTACVMSGFAGVYFEKILKGSEVSVWMRNIQLGLFGAVIGMLGVVIKDGAEIQEKGFFYGYNYMTWLAIANQAFGGLLVAVVVKYADNILKGYATSISIILSAIASVYLFDFELSVLFALGSSFVIAAVYMYS